jgi:hypothetical protein
MASSGKKKTTMAKLNRESRLRERRLDKQAKKDARKQAGGLQAVEAAQEQPPAHDDHLSPANDDHQPPANDDHLSPERSASPV